MNRITIGKKPAHEDNSTLADLSIGMVFKNMNVVGKPWCIKTWSSDHLTRATSLENGGTYSYVVPTEVTVELLQETLHLESPK